MAAPALSAAIGKFVTITLDTATGVTTNTPNTKIGLVEQVGLAVTQVAVGNYVMFKLNVVFSESPDTWAVVNEDDIYTIITPLP